MQNAMKNTMRRFRAFAVCLIGFVSRVRAEDDRADPIVGMHRLLGEDQLAADAAVRPGDQVHRARAIPRLRPDS